MKFLNPTHSRNAAYKNAAINAKVRLGASNFYKNALETIRYYKNANSHNVPTIQAYCNLMGYEHN